MIVTIPSSHNHDGFGLCTLEIADNCPACGCPRGRVFGTFSYDGSRRLNCDGWINDCGHVDTYTMIRKEGKPTQYKEPEQYGCYADGVQAAPGLSW